MRAAGITLMDWRRACPDERAVADQAERFAERGVLPREEAEQLARRLGYTTLGGADLSAA
jgi:hypothetical protein